MKARITLKNVGFVCVVSVEVFVGRSLGSLRELRHSLGVSYVHILCATNQNNSQGEE